MDNCNCQKKHNPFKGITALSRCEILAIINSVSLILSDGLEGDDLETLGALLSTIGDTVSVFASVSRKDAE